MLRIINIVVVLAALAGGGYLIWQSDRIAPEAEVTSGPVSEPVTEAVPEPAAEPGSPAVLSGPPGIGDGPGYVWDPAFEGAGYYLPGGTYIFQGWVLDHVFVGHPGDFRRWEEEGSDPDMIPLWIEFHHEDSEMAMGELGEYPVDTRRVRAQSFMVETGRFDFRGQDSELGEVIISGMFHPEHFQDVESGLPSGEPALTGGLEIGGNRIRNISFTHWLGD